MIAWLRPQPLLGGSLLLSILLGLGLLAWGWRLGQSNARQVAGVKREYRIWQQLADRELAPTEANVVGATAHLDALRTLTTRLRAGLEARGGWDPTPTYRGSEELFFELMSFVEAQREAFANAGIAVRPGEQFGYGQMVNDQQVRFSAGADETAVMARLSRQREALGWVLDALMAAAPGRLEAVERAPVQAFEEGALATMADLFEVDPLVSAAVPGAIETYGLRIEFAGRTEALRDFVSRLSGSRRPIVVRSIEVRPRAVEMAGPARAATSARASPFASLFGSTPPATPAVAEAVSPSIPLVESNESVFALVIEAYRLEAPAPGEGTAW